MGRNNDIIHFKQWVVRCRRLLLEHIQSRSGDPAGLQRLNHGRFINDGSPGGVDNIGRGLHHLKLLRAHQMEGGGKQGRVDDHKVRRSIDLFRRDHGHRKFSHILLLHKGVTGNDVHVKSRQFLHHQARNFAHADDAYGGVFQFRGLIGVALGKLPLPGQPIHANKALAESQQQRDDMLRHGVHIGVRRVDH